MRNVICPFMEPTARSLILDLLSTLRRGTMPVRALVAAAERFEIEENNVRVALARLLAAGQVERDERGSYRLGPGARPVETRVRSWSRLERRTRKWSGRWIGILEGERGRGLRQKRHRDRALRLLGFRPLVPGLSVRPDNLRGGIERIRGELSSLGLPAGDLVFALGGLDPVTDARARGLWDVAALRAGYRRSLSELEASLRRLAGAPPERAMVESFLLGGRVLRQLVLDPLLPEAILPVAERQGLVEAMRRYDRFGRSAWAGFLEEFDVPHLRAPVDTRMAAGASRLAL
jgi:phenylacetic acid degradation operon negative regulatory protein